MLSAFIAVPDLFINVCGRTNIMLVFPITPFNIKDKPSELSSQFFSFSFLANVKAAFRPALWRVFPYFFFGIAQSDYCFHMVSVSNIAPVFKQQLLQGRGKKRIIFTHGGKRGCGH